MTAKSMGYMGTEIEVEVSVDGVVDCRPSGLCHALDAIDDGNGCWGQDDFPCNSGSTGDWHGTEFTYKSKKNGGRRYDVSVKSTNEVVGSSWDCTSWMCFVTVYRGKNAMCS
jgi:hypothetical protein